jgi:hypothetical protein
MLVNTALDQVTGIGSAITAMDRSCDYRSECGHFRSLALGGTQIIDNSVAEPVVVSFIRPR